MSKRSTHCDGQHSASFYWWPWFRYTVEYSDGTNFDMSYGFHDYWFGWLWWQGRCTMLEKLP